MDLVGDILSGHSLAVAAGIVALWAVLSKMLFQPFIALHEERTRRLTAGESAQAAFDAKIKEGLAACDRKLAAAREAAAAERGKLRAGAQEREKKILETARAGAQSQVDKALANLDESAQAARKALAAEAKQLAKDLAGKVLQRHVG